MIEIITASGVSLDIDPSYEFEIEMENPMLDDTHIPIAYSTSIAFLPTAKNKSVFGYLAAMYREPDVKQLSVSIHAGGIPLFWGRLEYDSVEDGKLNYTFAGRDLEDEWGGYIHKLTHLSRIEVNRGNSYILQIDQHLKSIRDGNAAFIKDFEIPMIVGEENITDVEYTKNDIGAEKVAFNVKYHNYYWAPVVSIVTPAVKVASILSEAFKNVSISENISTLYGAVAILGLHRSKQLCALYGFQQTENYKLLLDVADMLPECTVLDLVTNIARLFCASIFREGQSFALKTNREVLADNTIIDWTDKVSDEYSLSREEESSYSFGYSNDDSENTYTTESESSGTDSGSIVDVGTMLDVIQTIENSSDYVAVRNLATGDMYSGKKMTVTTATNSQYTLPYMDMLLHKLHKVASDDEKENSFDNSVDFKCVRCIPVTSVYDLSPSITLHQVCPIIKFPAAEDERSSDIWIGALINNQLVDKGVYFERPTSTIHSNTGEWANSNLSLDPAVLYRRYHRPFAEWLSENRRVITTDVFLSLQEIADLRLYRKIMLYGQVFFIKKITHTFIANIENITTRVELIEAPMTISEDDKNIIYVEYWGDYEVMYFKAVSKYKVTSEIVVTVEVYDQSSDTLQSAVTLTIPLNSTQSETKTGVPFAITNISPREDSSQIYAQGGLKRV